MRSPPITERQALEWCHRHVDQVIARWIAQYELSERLAAKLTDDPTMRGASIVKANAYMHCAYELRHLELLLRAMTAPDKPMPPKLKLVINNARDGDKTG